MALSVSTIFKFSETPFKLKILAGKEGLFRSVSWVYYTEDPTTISFIRGGELAVTTCLNLERKKINEGLSLEEITTSYLMEFIDCFIRHNASGLIINIGKYIQTIPESVINYCNEKNFPLFSMPWEIHTIDLMQDIGNMIAFDNQNCITIEKTFYNAIFEKSKFDAVQLENTSFHNSKTYTVALMEIPEKVFNEDLEQAKRYIQYSFNPKMNYLQETFCSFVHNYKVIYIIKDVSDFFAKEFEKIVKSDRYFNDSRISISDSSDDIFELEELYNHAELTMKLGKSSGGLLKYENLGIYKILLEVKNRKVLEQFYQDTLGKIEELEPGKMEDYLQTLSLFLKLGGNVHAVSEENNTHRNTVLYRLQRLEEVLNIDLQDGITRTYLQIAMYIRTLLKNSVTA